MPLKEADLKTFEAYKTAVHKDGGKNRRWHEHKILGLQRCRAAA
jgi:hypothetical protein